MGDFLRIHWLKFVLAGVVACAIGLILLIVGIYYVANGEDSTSKQEFEKRIPLYQKWAEKEMMATTMQITTPAVSGLNSGLTIANDITWSDNTVTRFNQTLLLGTLSYSSLAAIRDSDNNIQVTTSMSYTTIQGTPTRTLTSTVQSASVPLINSTGFYLASMCIVIKREYANSEWLIDSDKKACRYPFAADSNPYRSTQPNNIALAAISQFDPFLILENYNDGVTDDGTGKVPNKALYLVDPNTPTVFGLGAFLLVGGIVTIIVFACCCRPKPLDGDPKGAQPGQQVQQGIPVSNTAV